MSEVAGTCNSAKPGFVASVVFGLGLLMDPLGYRFMAICTIDGIHNQLNTIQQQIAPAPASDAKTAEGKEGNVHRRH